MRRRRAAKAASGTAASVEVREVAPQEYAEAGRVTADAYREFVQPGDDDWNRYLETLADVAGRAGRTSVLVAVDASGILGTATLELDARIDDPPEDDGLLASHEAHIRMLGVSPQARGRGIARELMAACEARALDAGRTLMTLNTTERMEAAQGMYEALGYERREDRVFPDGFVLLTYAKRLSR
jgi:ribosomal protein S18 acetylase RimI-like enzyme